MTTAKELGYKKGVKVKTPYGEGVIRRIKNGVFIQWFFVYVHDHNREYKLTVNEISKP